MASAALEDSRQQSHERFPLRRGEGGFLAGSTAANRQPPTDTYLFIRAVTRSAAQQHQVRT
jgi:hypothetical protein